MVRPMNTRKALCVVAAFASLLTAGGGCLAQPLREHADRAGVLVGAAVEPRLLSEPAYAATLDAFRRRPRVAR
jgi:hypothetical protein